MSTPRAAAIHDLSGFGRCSLTVVMPTLSAMGVQCCPLPTAYLSTHTGGFIGNTFLDLTGQMAPVTKHWKECQIAFDAVYTGFMGSVKQMELTAEFIRTFKHPECSVVIDPVMGDHGKAYRTYTPDMCRAMRGLAEFADIITPNRTEAALLLGVDYDTLTLDSEQNCRQWVEKLSLNGQRSVVLTGIQCGGACATGAACFDRASGLTGFAYAPLAPGQFHGTGDLFASVLTGALAYGAALEKSVRLAAEFVSLCVLHTAEQNLPGREGVDFEPLLHRLWGMMDGMRATAFKIQSR